MLKLVLMITIVQRKHSENMITYFSENGVAMTFGRYARGTATDQMLNYLGIAEKEKCIAFSILPIELAHKVSKGLNKKIKDSFSCFVPISSVGGKNTMDSFENLAQVPDNKASNAKFTDELILIVINRGYVDTVMEIARSVGAPGGTVIHARGTGVGGAEKFFGVTVGAEKEMIFIVTEREKRDVIMKTIMEKAGANTPSGAVLFSLPVMKME